MNALVISLVECIGACGEHGDMLSIHGYMWSTYCVNGWLLALELT